MNGVWKHKTKLLCIPLDDRITEEQQHQQQGQTVAVIGVALVMLNRTWTNQCFVWDSC